MLEGPVKLAGPKHTTASHHQALCHPRQQQRCLLGSSMSSHGPHEARHLFIRHLSSSSHDHQVPHLSS